MKFMKREGEIEKWFRDNRPYCFRQQAVATNTHETLEIASKEIFFRKKAVLTLL